MPTKLGHVTKTANFENPRCRTADILKIVNLPCLSEQEAQVLQRDRATLRVIEYFAKSLKVIQNTYTVDKGVCKSL